MADDRMTRAKALKAFMARKKLRPHPWARAAGVRSSTLYNLLSGRSASLSADVLEKLASAAGVTVDDLLDREVSTTSTETQTDHVVIVRFVVATAGRLFVNEKEEAAPRPAGVAADVKLIAARVDGDGLSPLRSGWIVYIEADPTPPERLVGKLAMVTVRGRADPVIREVRRGSAAGLYTLLAWAGAPLDDVEIVEAHLVAALAQP